MLVCLPKDDDFSKLLKNQDLLSSRETPERGEQVTCHPRGAHPTIPSPGFEESPAREGRSRAEAGHCGVGTVSSSSKKPPIWRARSTKWISRIQWRGLPLSSGSRRSCVLPGRIEKRFGSAGERSCGK